MDGHWLHLLQLDQRAVKVFGVQGRITGLSRRAPILGSPFAQNAPRRFLQTSRAAIDVVHLRSRLWWIPPAGFFSKRNPLIGLFSPSGYSNSILGVGAVR